MPYTKFERSRCIAARFDRANLSHSIFHQVNAKNAFFIDADLTNINFSLTNLHKADLTKTNIICSQLQSALSFRDAQLPDERCAHESNLIKDGYADCNMPIFPTWTLTHGNIITMRTETESYNCHFVAQANDVEARMYQKINLEPWDSTFWKYSLVILEARMTSGVSIELSGRSRNGAIVDKKVLGNCHLSMIITDLLYLESRENNTIMRLHEEMKELQLIVKFSANSDQTQQKNNWCDDIKLFIEYGTAEVESLLGL